MPTDDVWESEELTHSTILGPDGQPLPYASRKLGYVGYVKLKERR